MNTAAVGVRAGFAEGVRIFVIRVQGLGCKQSVTAGDHMRDVVLVHPSHCTLHCHGERFGAKGEIIQFNFRGLGHWLLRSSPRLDAKLTPQWPVEVPRFSLHEAVFYS